MFFKCIEYVTHSEIGLTDHIVTVECKFQIWLYSYTNILNVRHNFNSCTLKFIIILNLDFPKKRILALSGFKSICHILAQCDTRSKSDWSDQQSSILHILYKPLYLSLTTPCKSAEYSKNSKGPKTMPWGTPDKTWTWDEKELFTF